MPSQCSDYLATDSQRESLRSALPHPLAHPRISQLALHHSVRCIKYGRVVKGCKRWREAGWRASLVLAGLLLLVVPVGSADAAEPLPAPYGFQLPATHGYTVSVMAGQSPKSTTGTVLLFVRSPHAEVIYGARASLSETSIDADLGSVGGVHVDFVPSGGTRSERPPCGGRPITFNSGSYVGTIDFMGEEAYSEAHALSARGELKTALGILCLLGGPKSEGSGGHSPGARLTVRSRRAPQFEFEAMKNSPTRPARFMASISERRGPLRISRTVRTSAGTGAFDFDVPGGFAHISPPAPFSGEATYLRAPSKPATWHGDLRVDFPGRSDVSLTGAGVLAGMQRAVLNPGHPFRVSLKDSDAGRGLLDLALRPATAPHDDPLADVGPQDRLSK